MKRQYDVLKVLGRVNGVFYVVIGCMFWLSWVRDREVDLLLICVQSKNLWQRLLSAWCASFFTFCHCFLFTFALSSLALTATMDGFSRIELAPHFYIRAVMLLKGLCSNFTKFFYSLSSSIKYEDFYRFSRRTKYNPAFLGCTDCFP